MEKHRTKVVVNGEITLPEDVIKHVQSFLSGKEAAQTTVLSKAWYSAWLTRPNLDFDQRDFKCRHEGVETFPYPDDFLEFAKKTLQRYEESNPLIFKCRNEGVETFLYPDDFLEFAKKTLQRYEESNLKIESFKLSMKWWVRNSYTLIKELVVRAINLGVTDLNLKLDGFFTFVLPPEVLESEALIRLSVYGCRIGDGKVRCSRLELLNLLKVHLEGDMIFEIISRCPLIEKLVLPECMCFTNVKRANDLVTVNKRMLELGPLTEIRKQNVDFSIDLFELHKLKYMFLEKVKIGTSFFSDFSSRFPCLNDLTVHHCFGYKEVQIYSPSLESISFAQKSVLKAKFDVPSIREFTFMGSNLPSLFIETPSTKWKSMIILKCNCPNTSWFLQLNKFLRNYTFSRICLCLEFEHDPKKTFDCKGVDIKSLPRPVVHDLFITTDMPFSDCSTLLGGVFSCCRPKVLGQIWEANNHLLEILCKTFTQVSEDCSISNPNAFVLSGLKAVNVEIIEDSVAQWQPLPWKTLLDASACPENRQVIQFKLSWGVEPSTF